MADNQPNPYENEEYRQQRQSWLGIIPKSAFLSSIRNNAGVFNNALVMSAVAAIVSGALKVPLWGTLALVGAALVAAGVSAYAGYKDEILSKHVGTDYNEASEIAKARVNAQELATVLKETLGEEIIDLKKENNQTQRTIAGLEQKMTSWQERETTKQGEVPRTLQ